MMSQMSKKKFKQATLSFTKMSPGKKRKLEEGDVPDKEHVKSRKTCDTAQVNPILETADENVTNENDDCLFPRVLFEKSDLPELCNTTREGTIPTTIESQVLKQNLEFSSEIKNEEMDVHVSPQKSVCDISGTEVEVSPATRESSRDVDVAAVDIKNGMKAETREIGCDVNKTSSDTIKKLTPKQIRKKEELEARRLEREKLKQEKEKKRLEEKEMKEKKRLAEIEAKNEEKRQKEEEKRLKEEDRKMKEEEKRKQKEAERKAKDEERKAKEEERKAKEEERKAKEEERHKKIEEKRQREEQEKKIKEKGAAFFSKFFLSQGKTNQMKTTVESSNDIVNSLFMPFEVKEDMKLAVMSRTTLTSDKKMYLDKVLKGNIFLDENCLYLTEIKSNGYKVGHSENTWPLNLNDDDDIKDGNSVSNDIRTRYRCKLLQFVENRRPAYWGTWRKRSKSISGKTPFKCDTKYFEYDVDSDEEWVEEPGESLHGSDDEKESDHEYEVDNDFFVPHGYLSDEEAPQDDEAKNEDPKSHTMKLDLLKNEFEAELKEKTCKLKSRFYGCSWISNSVQENEGASDVENLLLLFRGVWNTENTPFTWKPEVKNTLYVQSTENTLSSKNKGITKFPEQYLPDFIKLVHGNKNSRTNLAAEFCAYVLTKEADLNLTLLCVKKKLKKIAAWQQNTLSWYVQDDLRNEHDLGELSSLENSWKYVGSACSILPSKKNQKNTNSTEKQPATVSSNPAQVVTPITPKHSSIAKFVKVLTAEEKEKQLKVVAVQK